MAGASTEPESTLLQAFREIYAEGNRAWNAGDFRRTYGRLPEDFEYRLDRSWPNARPLHGPHEIVAFFEDFRQAFPDAHAEITEITTLGAETLLAGLRVTGTGHHSGASVGLSLWQVWNLGGGRPRGLREFHDRESALSAVRAGAPAEQG